MNDDISYGEGENGAITIHFKAGPYKGITFSFGKVWFPDESQPIMSFDYSLISGDLKETDRPAFEHHIGKMLEQLMRQAMEEETLIYTGGTNASGITNIVEPSDERNIFSKGPSVP
jgi:hypothetical protein